MVLSFRQFCVTEEVKTTPFRSIDKEAAQHWSEGDYVIARHGTHKRNIPDITDNGLTKKDPSTGMISVAIGPHSPSVALGYAGMSGSGGEHLFRQAGKKAVNVPREDRRVVVFHLPRSFVDKHVDRDFGGNPDSVKERLRSKEAHDKKPFRMDETPELRFNTELPSKYIHSIEVPEVRQKQ